jgi:hypothetical protein
MTIPIFTHAKYDDDFHSHLSVMIIAIIVSNKFHDNNNYHAYLINLTNKINQKIKNLRQ